jgi:predicted DNA-binding transcriptional regulator AlpA
MNAPLPNWPRMMKREKACAYVDLSQAEFEREIASGRLPQPVKLGNHPHWSRAELDACIDKLTGNAEEDWRARSPLYANGPR